MNKILSLLFVGLVSLQATNANADSLFRPRAAVGFAVYELGFVDPLAEPISSTSYLTLGAGATLAQDNIYFDASITTSLGASHDFTTLGQDEDFFRNDLALTVGLVLDQGVSVFGGYKSGTTEYENPLTGGTLMSFDTSGIFGGVSVSFPSGNDVVSVNGALAFMEGTLTDNDLIATPYDETADTIGLSFGAAYVSNITKETGIVFKGAYQYYSFTDWSGNYTLDDMDETILSFEAAYFVNF